MSALKSSLRLTPIERGIARRLLDAQHPLGAGLAFSLALGVLWDGALAGVLTWGGPVANVAGQAYGLRQDEVFELRKFWLADALPKNAESRALAVGARLVAARYPRFRLLITYCDEEERAAAYRAAGWWPQDVQRYLRDVQVDGRWFTVRDLNRRGGVAHWKPRITATRTVGRRKWAYPLDAAMAQRLARRADQRGDGGSTPTSRLQSRGDSASRPATGDSPAPTPTACSAAAPAGPARGGG